MDVPLELRQIRILCMDGGVDADLLWDEDPMVLSIHPTSLDQLERLALQLRQHKNLEVSGCIQVSVEE